MTKKPTTLAASLAKKTTTAAAETAPLAPSGDVRTLTLRLPIVVHDQLREMAYVSRKSQHALLLEGLNLLFERHGKPPIAA
jgi:hypothetical protein